VFAGAALNLFNRYAHRVTMTNIAQTINVLQCMAVTDGGKMFLTPTYYAYDMMRPHMGAHALTTKVEGRHFEGHPVGLKTKKSVPVLSASASVAGGKILLTVANQSIDSDIEARIELSKSKISAISGRILNADNARDMNSFAAPKTVVPKRFRADVPTPVQEWAHLFPAHSLTALSISVT
jgi:alpha-L-arabinofuranosidase